MLDGIEKPSAAVLSKIATGLFGFVGPGPVVAIAEEREMQPSLLKARSCAA